MSAPVHISVITPAYKCAECIEEMHRRLTQVLSAITPDYEIIFVDDRSPQNDWEIISGICAKDPHVRGVQLSRNYGQHFAITAGLDHARGEWIVVMDCDLQDRPEEIAKLAVEREVDEEAHAAEPARGPAAAACRRAVGDLSCVEVRSCG